MFGYDESEIVGRAIDILFTPEDRAEASRRTNSGARARTAAPRTSAGTCARTAPASTAAA
jgi:hypothetical protein